MSDISDPFRAKRRESGVLACEFHGETLPMILRHEAVRRAAKDWTTFSSDAPFRVPIPSEEKLRTMRQLPIVTLLSFSEKIERTSGYARQVGYEELSVRISSLP